MSQREVLRLYSDKIKEEKRTMAQEAKDDSHQKKRVANLRKAEKVKMKAWLILRFSYD